MAKKRGTATGAIAEAMEKEIRLDGKGEDPSVKAFINMLREKDPKEQVDIVVALQKHIQGVSLDDTQEGREVVRAMKANADLIKAAEEAWEKDQVGFMTDLFDKNPRPEGDRADRYRARKVEEFRQKIVQAQVKSTERKFILDSELKNGPKEDILVTGHYEELRGKRRIVPDVVKIMHRTFVLNPGRHTVPAVVAARYRQMQQLRAEKDARQDAMSGEGGGLEYNKFTQKQRTIDKKYVRSEFTGG